MDSGTHLESTICLPLAKEFFDSKKRRESVKNCSAGSGLTRQLLRAHAPPLPLRR